MINPFDLLDKRLETIEALLMDIKRGFGQQTPPATAPGYIDFKGMCLKYFPGIPESTVRQATAKIPKFSIGKRVVFDEKDIDAFLQSRMKQEGSNKSGRKPKKSEADTDREIEEYFRSRH